MRKRKKLSEQHRWVRNPEREEYWRKQIALWQESGLSVRAFCKEHGVVEPSFYAWRRELILRAREDGSAEELTSSERITPNELKDGRGRTIAIRFRQTDQPGLEKQLSNGPNPFVPIHMVENDKVDKERETSGPAIREASRQIEIVLPGGALMRLDDGCNANFVAQLLAALRA